MQKRHSEIWRHGHGLYPLWRGREGAYYAPRTGRRPTDGKGHGIAYACLTHDAYENLDQIQAITLVISGEKDKAFGGAASREIAAGIPNAQLHMYTQWGHGLYEEVKDFNQLVLECLK